MFSDALYNRDMKNGAIATDEAWNIRAERARLQGKKSNNQMQFLQRT